MLQAKFLNVSYISGYLPNEHTFVLRHRHVMNGGIV